MTAVAAVRETVLHVQHPWAWWWVPPDTALLPHDPDEDDRRRAPRHPADEYDWDSIAASVRTAVRQVIQWTPADGVPTFATAHLDVSLPEPEETMVRRWLGEGGMPVVGDLYPRPGVTDGHHRLWAARQAGAGVLPVQAVALKHLPDVFDGGGTVEFIGVLRTELSRMRDHWATRTPLLVRQMNTTHIANIDACLDLLAHQQARHQGDPS